MRILSHILTTFTVMCGLAFGACSDNVADGPLLPEADCMRLSVSVPLAMSRAVDDELNEFKVESLHLFFFKKDGFDAATSEWAFDAVVDDRFSYRRDIILAMPDDALKADGLFGLSSDECFVYAVANVNESDISARTVDGLKATAVVSNFAKTEIQSSFTMDGFATLSLDRANRIVSGTITLQRSAAKLTLAVDLPASIDVEQTIVSPIDGTTQVVNTTYYSRAEDMHVWIANGVMASKLNAPALPADEAGLFSNKISAAEGSTFTFAEDQPKYKYIQTTPFYSYPNKWDPYSPKGNCFLTLVIPWYFTDSNGAFQNIVTYYRLSVQPNKNYLERNTHYDMRVTIGRLGGITVQKPVDMLFDWNYNMQWNVQTLPTDIKEIRYLLLNNNDFSSELDAYYYEMANETSISIPYNTSHPVEIEEVKLIWHDFKNDDDREITLTQNGRYPYSGTSAYNPTQDFAGINLDAAKSTLNLKRDILHIAWNNGPRITNETAINAYTFRIKLRHTDATANDPSANATVVITQIPAIYITSQRTPSGTRFINDQNTEYNIGTIWKPIYKGYLGSNTPGNNQQRRYWLGSSHEESSGYINNKNTYILTISKFAEDDNYIIADPRTRNVDNINENIAVR